MPFTKKRYLLSTPPEKDHAPFPPTKDSSMPTLLLRPAVAARLANLFSATNPHTLEAPAERLARLRARYAGCMRCPLARQGRQNVVFGEGNPEASIMFIGEAPGRDEDILGRPFVGRSGKLLTKMLDSLGFTRDVIFISNAARCRPPANRPPTPEETNICISHILLREISIVRPRVICTLGATATSVLLEYTKGLSPIRGQLLDTDFFALLPTFHPAYLLRNPAATATVEADFLKLMPFLATKK